MSNEKALLQNSIYFSGFDDEVIDRFLSCAEHKSLSEGEILFVEMAEEDDIYFLLEGEVKLEAMLADEEHPKEVFILKPGDLPGVSAFISPGPRIVTATAMTNISLLCWKYDDWDAICKDYPQAGFHICREIAKTLMHVLRYEEKDMLDHLEWGT